MILLALERRHRINCQVKQGRASIVALDIAGGRAGFLYSSHGYQRRLESASSRNKPK